MVGPYNITQFSAAEAIGMYDAAKQNRLQQMLTQRQLDEQDRQIKQRNDTAAAWAKILQPKGGDPASSGGMGGAAAAYGSPATAPPIAAPPADPLAPLPDNAPPAATAPAAAPSAASAPTVAPAPAASSGPLQIDPQAARELATVLGPEQGMQFLQHWQALDDAQKKAVAEHNDEIGQAIVWADTPEKWDHAVDVLSRDNPELARYKGHFDQRPDAAMSVHAMKQFMEGTQPKYRDVNGDVINEKDLGTGRDPVAYRSEFISTPDGLMRRSNAGATPPQSTLQPGAVEDGYRFKGGNAADPNNWEPIGGAPATPARPFP